MVADARQRAGPSDPLSPARSSPGDDWDRSETAGTSLMSVAVMPNRLPETIRHGSVARSGPNRHREAVWHEPLNITGRDGSRRCRNAARVIGERRIGVCRVKWCPGRDLNPDGFPHTPLKRTRIPIPPPGPEASSDGTEGGT